MSLTAEIKKETFSGSLRHARILVVDDDPDMYDLIKGMLEEKVAEIQYASTFTEGKEAILEKNYNLALLDISFPDGNGFDLITIINENRPGVGIVLMTGYLHDDIVTASAGLQFPTIIKPFTAEQLRFVISRELARTSIPGNLHHYDFDGVNDNQPRLTGSSTYITKLRHHIAQIAKSDLPVLIQGPTGTSKEIIARLIHEHSNRYSKPMITINSSAIPEHLEESEFFGHVKGAFTGAHHDKDGIFMCADKTTLFLDEVGELSLRMQAKLLRVLDSHEFSRIGETRPRKSDFRLISATNRPLPEMIKNGSFRQDLYFRLRAAQIMSKPLVEHSEDIPELVEEIVEKVNRTRDWRLTVDPEAIDILKSWEWPGNIRELKNAVEAICINSFDSGKITANSVLWYFNAINQNDVRPIPPFTTAKNDFEKNYYESLLARFHGNISMASRAAGLERAYFSKKIKSLGLKVDKYRQRSDE
jgi:two-component system, NtrC family, nitrogen regulation response regulator NtrX